MTDPTNEDRGNRVITLLDAYIEIVEPGDEVDFDVDYVFTDLIADLLHLAHLRGHDAEKIVGQALNHFENEILSELPDEDLVHEDTDNIFIVGRA
jgi:hypothetical protein